MMMRRGLSLLEVIVVVAIIAMLGTILLPSLMRARELSRQVGAAADGELEAIVEVEPAPKPTVEDMEEAAEEAADEHDIYDRVVALTENAQDQQLSIRVSEQSGVDSFGRVEVLLKSNADLEAAQVRINGRKVYDQTDGEIQTYLGMGEWEHLLGGIENKVAADREERFRLEREKRFGPLPGWGNDG